MVQVRARVRWPCMSRSPNRSRWLMVMGDEVMMGTVRDIRTVERLRYIDRRRVGEIMIHDNTIRKGY